MNDVHKKNECDCYVLWEVNKQTNKQKLLRSVHLKLENMDVENE
jgi:hypothetical protein